MKNFKSKLMAEIDNYDNDDCVNHAHFSASFGVVGNQQKKTRVHSWDQVLDKRMKHR